MRRLIILGVVLAGLAALVGWVAFSKQSPDQPVPDDSRGKIAITFKGGTSPEQAKKLVESMGLPYQDDAQFPRLTPWYNVVIPKSQVSTLAGALKQEPQVVGVNVNTVPTNSYGNSGSVHFKYGTSDSNALQILDKYGITQRGQRLITNDMTLSVPAGKENFYIKKFRASSLIESAGFFAFPTL